MPNGFLIIGILFVISGSLFVVDSLLPPPNPCAVPNPPQNCLINSTSSTSSASGGSVTITLASSAPNIGSLPNSVSFDNGQPALGLTVSGLAAGSVHTISAVSPITFQSKTYTFASWSDGGAQSHQITAPASGSATYTVTYNIGSITPMWGLVVNTIAQGGAALNGQIVVDGNAAGSGQVSVQLPIGSHTVTCGALSGYSTPAPETFILGNSGQPNPYSVLCIYVPSTTPTTTLSVTAQICSAQTKVCFPDTVDNVIVTPYGQSTGGTSLLLNAAGQASFIVQQNSQYTVTINSIYGTYSQAVQIGTSPTSLPTITFVTSGLSVVAGSVLAPYLTLGGSLSTGVFLEQLMGGFFIIFGIIVAAWAGRKNLPVQG